MERKTQTEEIVRFLQTHKSGLTSKEAFERFGATRLSGIIYDLKHRRGMRISSENVVVKNRYGGKTIVSCYKLMD